MTRTPKIAHLEEPCEVCGLPCVAPKDATPEEFARNIAIMVDTMKSAGVKPCKGCLEASDRLGKRLEAGRAG